jgi:hypothetical protein
MCTQVVGKVKLTLTPFLNEWWNVAFSVTARGLTSGPVPFGQKVFQVDFDFVDHHVAIHTSEGLSIRLPLVARPVADFYLDFMQALASLDVHVRINTRPVEVDDGIPFEADRQHAAYDPAFVNRWWRVMLGISRVMERYRTAFVGKSSPVLFWWGSFDLATTRYSGRPAPARAWPTRWMALAADQEDALAGFWPGNERLPEPALVAYTAPEPPGCRTAAIHPDAAFFHPELAEFVLPYASVRYADDPEQTILDFYNSAYEIGVTLAGWDRAALDRRPASH